MSNIKPFSTKNLNAYSAVFISMTILSLLLWSLYLMMKYGGFELQYFSTYSMELVFSFIMVMSGMMIMFVASLLNLRKMRSGWEKMAKGEQDVDIPNVWCPVLTTAKQAAEEFTKNKIDPTRIETKN